MQLANVTAIHCFVRKHRDSARWLANWLDIAQSATWQSILDVRAQFPTADGVALKNRVIVTVFNVKGNEYRMLTVISYKEQRIVILDVMTHAEYDKQKWK